MKVFKKSILPIFLTLTLCFCLIIPSFLSTKEQTVVRNIDVEEIGAVSYEEKVEQLLGQFDEYNFDTSGDSITFEGVIDISSFDLYGVNFLSSNADTTIKKYKTNLDAENEKFYVVTQYIQDNIVVYEESVESKPYYDENSDDYYVEMPDGSVVSVYNSLMENNFNECLVLTTTAVAATELALLLASTVIICSPTITTTITTVVTTIVSWVKSFFSWFRSLFTRKTTKQITQVVTTTITYTITIAGTQIKAEKFEDSKDYEESKYYIAIADTADGFLYVTKESVSDTVALAILTTATYVTGATKNSHGVFPQLVISLYTKNGYDAYLIAVEAGTILLNPGATHHIANRTGYYNHYHPGGDKTHMGKPHVFYGEAV